MKISQIEKLIREEFNKILKEYSPQISPSGPDREVITKPETDEPIVKPRRRSLTPPTQAPETKPKAEGIEQKIASRFNKLKNNGL